MSLFKSPLNFLEVSLASFTCRLIIGVVGVARNSNGDKIECSTNVTSSGISIIKCEVLNPDEVEDMAPQYSGLVANGKRIEMIDGNTSLVEVVDANKPV